ncbi:hypothetical protein ACTFIU_010949 [Dictyostelium citrinum]
MSSVTPDISFNKNDDFGNAFGYSGDEEMVDIEEHKIIRRGRGERGRTTFTKDEMNSSSDEDSQMKTKSQVNQMLGHVFGVKHITSYPHNSNNIQNIFTPINNFISNNYNQNDNNNNSIGQGNNQMNPFIFSTIITID